MKQGMLMVGGCCISLHVLFLLCSMCVGVKKIVRACLFKDSSVMLLMLL